MAVPLPRLRSLVGALLVAALVPMMGASVASASVDPDTVDPNIVGGNRASTSTYPYAVFLTVPNSIGGDYQFCGGTLVKPNKVVTAAHCLVNKKASDISVVAGRNDKKSTAGAVAKVSKMWVHPDYKDFTIGHDLAVLTLATNLKFSTLPLATPSDRTLYSAGTKSTILGWGYTDEPGSGGLQSRYLLKAAVPLTSDATCKSAYVEYNATAMVCAGYPQGGTDTCIADSGGPLVAGGKLIGITSWDEGCARKGFPGIYTRVATYASLINAQL